MKKLESKQLEIMQGGGWDSQEVKWLLCGVSFGSLFIAPSPAGVAGTLVFCVME